MDAWIGPGSSSGLPEIVDDRLGIRCCDPKREPLPVSVEHLAGWAVAAYQGSEMSAGTADRMREIPVPYDPIWVD